MPIPPVDPTAPSTLGQRIVTPFAKSSAGRWWLMNVARHIDPTLVRLTRGHVSSLMVTPEVLLTTTGARSGLERTVPLVYFTDADRVILIASNFGGTRHPAWYHNVMAHPEVTLYAGGYEGRFTGAPATGPERERLWGLAVELTSAYAKYETMTGGREIPVMAFTPSS